MFAFSASLKNIYGVDIKGKSLILHTNDKTTFETVNDVEKKGIILNILKTMGKDIESVEVVYDDSTRSQQDIIKELKDTFLDKIKIK